MIISSTVYSPERMNYDSLVNSLLTIKFVTMKKINVLVVSMAVAIFSLSSCDKEEKVTKSDAVSFEEIVELNADGFYNGSDGSGGFTSLNAIFKTYYNNEWKSWSGFAVSNHTDNLTPGYENQYSSVTGSGAGPSEKYGVLYSNSADTIEFIIPAKITNISISNSTYTYYTIKNGNEFAKKFGGDSGNDPDYFDLHISVVNNKGIRQTFDPIPLADYTFENNELDYISKEWEYYDLSNAGYVKYLIFSFASSDTSVWGINTPKYVCIDNLVNEWVE